MVLPCDYYGVIGIARVLQCCSGGCSVVTKMF